MAAQAARPSMGGEVANTFFDHASDGALVINRARRIVTLNSAGAQLTGWKQRDLTSINCSVLKCRTENGKPACGESCLAQRCIETRQKIGPMYLRVSRADGSSVPCEASFVPLPGSSVSECMLLLKDIGILEMMDSRVRALGQDLAEKNIVLRGFSEQMSVAWRAPIAEIRAGADQLRASHGKALGEASSRTIERMALAAQKLETTFAELKAQIQTTLQSRAPRRES